jgi:hypothetical protein
VNYKGDAMREPPIEIFVRSVLAGSSIRQALELAAPDYMPPEKSPKVGGMGWIIAGDPLNIKHKTDVDIFNIPSPTCITRHLPVGRKPTREELKEAWRACTSR